MHLHIKTNKYNILYVIAYIKLTEMIKKNSYTDEIAIEDLIEIDNFCPHCEEEEILESLRFIMFEEDVADAYKYYRENGNLCKYCLAELNI